MADLLTSRLLTPEFPVHIFLYLSSWASESEEPPRLQPFLHELLLQEQLEELGRPPEADLELLLHKEQRRAFKKRRRSKQKKQRQRHFNELWVRMEER